MLRNIMNLEGVAVLTKEQQKSVNGGQTCRFSVTMNGETRTFFYRGFAEGESGSQQANNQCVSVLTNTQASSCRYDCAYDGMGN